MATNPFVRVAQALTPPLAPYADGYEGVEYRWKVLYYRPALFEYEPYLIAVVFAYLAVWLWGTSVNKSLADKWFDAHLPILVRQFSRPTNDGLTADGYSDFFNFSTGRRYVTSLHTVFKLRPRHDLLQLVWQFGQGLYDLRYSPKDEVNLEFEFAPSANVPEFVFAVVAKDELSFIKDARWDLTFCKTADNIAVPPTFSVMSESADVTTTLLKPMGNLDLSKVLSNPAIRPYFRSLSITDQPDTRPELPLKAAERKQRLIVSLVLPPLSDVQATTAFVESVFGLVDAVANGKYFTLRPETKTKLRATREKLDKDLRAEAQKEKKEEAAEEKAAAKRKAEQERIAKLSAAEQKKVIDKEKRRALRKSQGKGTVRKA